jgi:hypothetical protein
LSVQLAIPVHAILSQGPETRIAPMDEPRASGRAQPIAHSATITNDQPLFGP